MDIKGKIPRDELCTYIYKDFAVFRLHEIHVGVERAPPSITRAGWYGFGRTGKRP
jgi:hypothetical protein